MIPHGSFIDPTKPDEVDTPAQIIERTILRQSYFAKWDGEKFLYGKEAAEYKEKYDYTKSDALE